LDTTLNIFSSKSYLSDPFARHEIIRNVNFIVDIFVFLNTFSRVQLLILLQ
jgi:hypothetical protein